MAASSFQPRAPATLTAEDKARVDQGWQEALGHFENAFTDEDWAHLSPLKDEIADEVCDAWMYGEYGDQHKGEDLPLLAAKVYQTVDEALERWVHETEWNEELQKHSKGEDEAGKARWKYVRGYKAEYKRRWLGKHQQVALDYLKDAVRRTEERGEELEPESDDDIY
ncbi:MAG: hypothetical protein LQ346_003353 [Caloplaca aetnensis]|nr:MAG: hypothetical protein LQ346_003353 [Caloplaca aetnensis]